MAKARVPAKKKQVNEEVQNPAVEAAAEPKSIETIPPQRVHELFGIPGPYEPPPQPIGLKGFVTFWDPGMSIRTLVKKHRGLFFLGDHDGKFANETDQWTWKQLRLLAAETGQPFDEQRKALKLGEPPTTREVVVFLVLHFLATGERIEIPRLRCKDVVESGRRVIVGPFGELGLDLANVSDSWKSPGIGLAEVCVARRK